MADIDLAAARADYEAYRAARDGSSGLEDYVAAAEAAANRVPALLNEISALAAQVRSRDAALDVVRGERDEMVVTANRFEGQLDEARGEIERLRAERDQALVEHKQAFASRERYREEVHRLREHLDKANEETADAVDALNDKTAAVAVLAERLADAEHEREVLREGAADLDERLQLALKDEGRARSDYDAAALLLGRALVERDQARAQRNAAMREQAAQVREVERLRSALADAHGEALDAVDTVAALTGADGEVVA